MDGDRHDRRLLDAAFAQIAAAGWTRFSLVEACHAAGLPLAETRARFPDRTAVLLRLGRMADEVALADVEQATEAGPPLSPRERLFDMMMRRLDVFQQHRTGVLAVLDALPGDPATAVMLAAATRTSLGWLADAAGLPVAGVGGLLRMAAIGGAWLAAVQAWRRDESADLASTMAALDRALDRVSRLDGGLAARPADGSAAFDDAVPATPMPDNDLADVVVLPETSGG